MTKIELDHRAKRCDTHKLFYNAEEGECPLCTEQQTRKQLSDAALHPKPIYVKREYSVWYMCKICKQKTQFSREVCGKSKCEYAAGIIKSPRLKFICPYCGGRCRNENGCTRYACRKQNGTQLLYKKHTKNQIAGY